MDLYKMEDIRLLLARHGFSFSKNLGQNFLCDREIPAKIAAGAGITPETCVLEIGPGIGALSAQLCKSAKKVVAIELDDRLPAILSETMEGFPQFKLMHGDVLKTDLRTLCREEFGDAPVIACANLPYYITTPAITALLECECFQRVVVMVQKEAAMRLCAPAGAPDYSAFTAQVAYFARAERILEVPRDRFVPQPKVDSSVLRLEVYPKPPVEGKKREIFRVIRASFANRRKTLVNGLCLEYGKKLSKPQAAALLAEMGLPENIRGEALDLKQFAELSVRLHNYLEET